MEHAVECIICYFLYFFYFCIRISTQTHSMNASCCLGVGMLDSVGMLLVVSLQVSACVTSTTLQGVVIILTAIYCIAFGVGLKSLDVWCDSLIAGKQDGAPWMLMVHVNSVWIQPLLYRVISNGFIFGEMCRYYTLVEEQRSLAEMLFFGKF